MEKPAPVLIVLLIAAILLSDNFLENTSELDDRIVELEEDNSEKEGEILALNQEINQLNHLVSDLNAEVLELRENNSELGLEIERLEGELSIANARIANLNAQVQGLLAENSALETEINNLEAQFANASASIEGIMSEIPDPLEGCYILEPEHTWALDPCPPTIFIIGENPTNITQNEDFEYTDWGAVCWNGTDWVSHEVEVSGDVVNLARVGTYLINYNCGEAPQVTRVINVVAQNSGGSQGDGGGQGDDGGQQGQG